VPGADDDLLADWRFHDAPRPKGRRRRPAASAREALELTARELRLVLTVLFVIFVTSESWQVFGRLSGVRYAVLIALFAVLAAVLGALGTRKAARAAAAPAEGLRRPVPDAARATLARRLRRRAWFEVLVVGLAVSSGFLVLGALVVDETLTRAWATIEDDRGFARLPVSEIWTDRVAGSLEIYPLVDSGLALSEPPAAPGRRTRRFRGAPVRGGDARRRRAAPRCARRLAARGARRAHCVGWPARSGVSRTPLLPSREGTRLRRLSSRCCRNRVRPRQAT
jgi:hypothetical protein